MIDHRKFPLAYYKPGASRKGDELIKHFVGILCPFVGKVDGSLPPLAAFPS